MYRINEMLVAEGKLKEGCTRDIKNAWKMSGEQLMEIAGFNIEEKIGSEKWEKAILTDERRNRIGSTIQFAETYKTDTEENYIDFICQDICKMVDSYE